MHCFPIVQSKNMPKHAPSFTFPALFTLTGSAVYEYNRIDGLYHELHDRPNAIPVPAYAGVEGGRVDSVHPTMQ